MTEAELRVLQDRHAIEERTHRCAWRVDRREWKLMDKVLPAGTTIDYTSTGGIKGEYRATLAWLDRALTSQLAPLYPERDAFWRVRPHLVPKGVYVNPFLRRTLGSEAAPRAHPPSDGA